MGAHDLGALSRFVQESVPLLLGLTLGLTMDATIESIDKSFGNGAFVTLF